MNIPGTRCKRSYPTRLRPRRRRRNVNTILVRRAGRTPQECFHLAIGHKTEAALLKKFLSWTAARWDFDQFINEETLRQRDTAEVGALVNGWMTKTWDELCDGIADQNKHAIRRDLRSLIKRRFLYEREDPVDPWEHINQYRLNLIKLEAAMIKYGLCFDENFSLSFRKGSDAISGLKHKTAEALPGGDS